MGIAFLEAWFGGHIETHPTIIELPNYALIRPLSNSSFLDLKLNENNIPEQNNSIIDCLYRAICNRGFKPVIKRIKNVSKNSFNEKIDAIIVSSVKKGTKVCRK